MNISETAKLAENYRLPAIAIMPGGAIDECQGPEPKSQPSAKASKAYAEFSRLMALDPYGAAIFLGFHDGAFIDNPSIEFIRSVAALLVRKVAHNAREVEDALKKYPILSDVNLNAAPITATKISYANELFTGAAWNYSKISEFCPALALSDDETADIEARRPFVEGDENFSRAWLLNFWNGIAHNLAVRIAKDGGSAAGYFSKMNPSIHPAERVYFHLVEAAGDNGPFAFMATYSAEISESGKTRHLPLKNALTQYGGGAKLLALLSAVTRAAEKSALIKSILDSGEIFHPLRFDTNDALVFLKESSVYEKCGIACRIPAWWDGKRNAVSVKVRSGTRIPSLLGGDALVDFDASISLGDIDVTPGELRKIAAGVSGLLMLKGKWVEIDRKAVLAAIAAFEEFAKGGRREMTLMEALKLEPGSRLSEAAGGVNIEVTRGEWLESVVARLRSPEKIAPADCGEDFRAALREYQKQGVSWLGFLRSIGFGACLADDMGLGKTLQTLALLNAMPAETKTLLVVPASIIGNWTAEIERFAPRLKFHVLHASLNGGDRRARFISAPRDLSGINITTYGMLVRLDWLKKIKWDNLILDEAQAIKNPETKQSKAARSLDADFRAALTGTPVENGLTDLWTIFDFLNKGLLGTRAEFDRAMKNAAGSSEGYSRLRRTVAPFILRRLKTDKTVIADLPEKIEMKTYSTLSKKQAALYSELVEEIRLALEEPRDDIDRKALILSSIIRFKQICNHPDHYLGQDFYDAAESGKFERLTDICETIRDRRERMLVFTQFRQITGPLAAHLEGVFKKKGIVLHGETPVKERAKLVDKFQGRDYVPFMVLSLKAGGVGLNLTEANHVVHFDRWWNPAVENQATDRAFRIGQRRGVVVHKFITRGTLEEKIDSMIEKKKKLSGEIVPDIKQDFLTELDNKRLMEILSYDAF